MESTHPTSKLPEIFTNQGMTLETLSYLDPKSLAKCREVCQTFKNFIDNESNFLQLCERNWELAAAASPSLLERDKVIEFISKHLDVENTGILAINQKMHQNKELVEKLIPLNPVYFKTYGIYTSKYLKHDHEFVKQEILIQKASKAISFLKKLIKGE